MTQQEREALRESAREAAAATPPRSAVERALARWTLQTSNSFRRIGCHGDGDVLCGTKHPVDGHPDLLSPRGVLDYIVAAQPRVVLGLLDDLDAAEARLAEARAICEKTEAIEQRLFQVNANLGALMAIVHGFTSEDPTVVTAAREALANLTASLTTDGAPA